MRHATDKLIELLSMVRAFSASCTETSNYLFSHNNSCYFSNCESNHGPWSNSRLYTSHLGAKSVLLHKLNLRCQRNVLSETFLFPHIRTYKDDVSVTCGLSLHVHTNTSVPRTPMWQAIHLKGALNIAEWTRSLAEVATAFEGGSSFPCSFPCVVM